MSTSPIRPVVLLIEDSEDDVFFFRHALKKTGFACTVVHVGDGGAALQYLKSALAGEDGVAWPDLVFLDLKLPTFSGFEILTWIRENGIEGRLDVAILSGSEHSTDIQRGMSLGATDYLVKPVQVDLLSRRIHGWSERKPLSSAGAFRDVPAKA